MVTAPSERYAYDLTGGRLCLDFANTVNRGSANPTDHLRSYGDLLAFGEQTGIAPPAVARELGKRAAAHPAVARVAAARARFVLEVEPSPDDLLSLLAPIVKSAVDLLSADEVVRVRACAAATCDWLFIDTTKNHTRRWCDMKICGNRAKVQRFRSRY